MYTRQNFESGAGQGGIGGCTLSQGRGMRAHVARAICLAALALVGASPLAAQAASKALAVSATVKANAIMQVEYQAQQLVVTPADVARGYCDAPAASRVRVSSNS